MSKHSQDSVMQITSGQLESVKNNNSSSFGERFLALKYILEVKAMRVYTLHGMVWTPYSPCRDSFADSVSPEVGSEQWELDLKEAPHIHLQIKGIVLQIKESVHHSPDTCSTAQVSMMFAVPPSAIHFPAVEDRLLLHELHTYHHLVTFRSVPILNFLFTFNTLFPTLVRCAIEFTTVGTVLDEKNHLNV